MKVAPSSPKKEAEDRDRREAVVQLRLAIEMLERGESWSRSLTPCRRGYNLIERRSGL